MSHSRKRVLDHDRRRRENEVLVDSANSVTLGRGMRVTILVAGLILPQIILFGPSLIGRKILLPLDILADDGIYLPHNENSPETIPHNMLLNDQVFTMELSRRFATKEFRAGRLPLWSPSSFAGTPFAAWGKYSPFNLIYYLFPSAVTLAWIQLFKSIVAGVGTYLFFRQSLKVDFWPSAIGAWCYPLTAFFIFWQGYPITFVTAWLGWILLATDRVVRQPNAWWAAALALLTAVVISGKVDMAGQVLLTSGFYAIWCLIDHYRKRLISLAAVRSTAAVIFAWLVGFLLVAPYLLPTLDYARTGGRMEARSEGVEERPPIGITALPLTVLPHMYGSSKNGSKYFGKIGNVMESASTTYIGLVATFAVAPLAFCSRRHRSVNAFWIILGCAGLAWTLNAPGFVAILRMPLLNMMSHNRFVFATSFALLAMAVVGLNVVWKGGLERRWWFLVPTILLVGILGWCLFRSAVCPEPLATSIEDAITRGQIVSGVPDMAALATVKKTFTQNYLASAMLCLLALAGWLILLRRAKSPSWLGLVVSLVLIADLLWFARDENPQCDPSLYYPKISILEKIAAARPGRVLGVSCLPPRLYESHGLRDIRGYDAVDPARYLEFLAIDRDDSASSTLPYARTIEYVPKMYITSDGRLFCPPTMNMLNLRYLIGRSAPPPGAKVWAHEKDYFVLENATAMPRVYIPSKVETVPSDAEMLNKLSNLELDPRKIAYVERPVSLTDNCRGSASLVDEVPTRLTISLDMQTSGLVVLADRWDKGWRAYLNERAVPLLRTNYIFRGVVAPAGKSTLVFRYEPESLRLGIFIMIAGLVGLALCCGLGGWQMRKRRVRC